MSDNAPENTNTNPVVNEENKGFDPSTLNDEDLAKLFDDERLYKHKRFSDLREQAKKAKEFEEKERKAEEERLKTQGEYQKLAEQKDKELNDMREKVRTKELNLAIRQEAMQAGVVDVDAVLALIDKSKISIDEEGNVQGVKDAVDGLLAQKQYLLTKKSTTLGSPTNPTNTDTTVFTMSQISDPVFYQKNRDAIQIAQREGRIKEDRR